MRLLPIRLLISLLMATFVAAPVSAQLRAAIDGMEITQAIQHYKSHKHLRDGSDYGADNSIPLIAGKTTYVRTYVRRLSGRATPVVGTLVVERRSAAGWTAIATIEAANRVTPAAQPNYLATRESAARTLNFVVPGTHMQGTLRFTASVRTQGTSAVLAQSEATADASLQRTLRLAAVTVGYRGPSGGTVITAPPPGADVVRTVASHAVASFPVSDAAEFRVVGTITQTEPLIFAPSTADTPSAERLLACPRTWSRLMKRVREIRRADGPRPGWLYYGLLANEIPYAGNTTGCGGGGVGTGKVERPETMSHELGHAAAQPHIPGINNRCTGDGAVSSYPHYEKQPRGSYRRGSIGEFGIDSRTGMVLTPRRNSDIMQYCRDRWTSPWMYLRLMDQEIFADQDLSVASGGGGNRYEQLGVVTAILDASGVAEDYTFLELSSRAEPLGVRLPDTIAERLDAAGQVVASASVWAVPLNGDSYIPSAATNCPCIIEASLRGGSGGAIRVRRGSKELFRIARPATAGLPLQLTATAAKDGVELAWTGVAEDSEVWIRYSDDAEATWRMLDVGRFPKAFKVSLDRLPPAQQLTFEILTANGAETRRAVAAPIKLAASPDRR